MVNNKSKAMRENPLFMRNEFPAAGQWGIPLVKKQGLDISNVHLVAYSDTRPNDREENKQKGVHFFIDDYRFMSIYRNPKRSWDKLSQYAFLLTPDYSTYADMNPWRQIESVAHSRWCGAYWQSLGKTVIPTISWSTASSYRYCFDGVETGTIVAVGMIGCKNSKKNFLRGYEAMLERIQPEAVICFGTPFPEMRGHIVAVDYLSSRNVVR